MSPGALVVGEALIDEVVEGDRITCHTGGSPANVAVGLARLNVVTRLHTAIGNDADGESIHRHLTASGVTMTPESVTSGPTSKAEATLAHDGSATYRFALSWDPAPLEDVGTPELIHTGSLGAFLEPGSEVSRDIIRRGKDRDALVTFDPNIRPSLVPEWATTRALFEALAFSSHLTKLSDEDAEFLFPGKSPYDVLDILVDGGTSLAVVTRGDKGAYLASGHHRVSVPPVHTQVADTVGAGDSFMAALIWALAFNGAGWDGGLLAPVRLEAVGATAARAAAITVSRPGADMPYLSDLPADPRYEGETR
ncbi:carbohydrate kinase [Diaminobutyricibacter tongyongensis]|uniref:Carbohydrate kinase n=1 Tax=Leifsonia tongyongensis TaxID=1268043 RepID=A0A6L9XTB1_9MICO|nr:carbohydrate kinase [Diaminobutyricibacter tongyongensis]